MGSLVLEDGEGRGPSGSFSGFSGRGERRARKKADGSGGVGGAGVVSGSESFGREEVRAVETRTCEVAWSGVVPFGKFWEVSGFGGLTALDIRDGDAEGKLEGVCSCKTFCSLSGRGERGVLEMKGCVGGGGASGAARMHVATVVHTTARKVLILSRTGGAGRGEGWEGDVGQVRGRVFTDEAT